MLGKYKLLPPMCDFSELSASMIKQSFIFFLLPSVLMERVLMADPSVFIFPILPAYLVLALPQHCLKVNVGFTTDNAVAEPRPGRQVGWGK